jgi:hypothetical protein
LYEPPPTDIFPFSPDAGGPLFCENSHGDKRILGVASTAAVHDYYSIRNIKWENIKRFKFNNEFYGRYTLSSNGDDCAQNLNILAAPYDKEPLVKISKHFSDSTDVEEYFNQKVNLDNKLQKIVSIDLAQNTITKEIYKRVFLGKNKLETTEVLSLGNENQSLKIATDTNGNMSECTYRRISINLGL